MFLAIGTICVLSNPKRNSKWLKQQRKCVTSTTSLWTGPLPHRYRVSHPAAQAFRSMLLSVFCPASLRVPALPSQANSPPCYTMAPPSRVTCRYSTVPQKGKASSHASLCKEHKTLSQKHPPPQKNAHQVLWARTGTRARLQNDPWQQTWYHCGRLQSLMTCQ